MAYFLDEELAALTTESARPTPQKGGLSVVNGDRRPNKFGKRCHSCGTWVPAQKGYLGKDGGAWVVYCNPCP
jgi:hypothetical protein